MTITATAEYQREWRQKENHKFAPRTKMALQMYISGAARTQREAAAACGVTPQAISIARNTSTGRRLELGFDTQLQERNVSLSVLIAKLSEKALDVMEEQITNGSTEDVRFKAAKDILDRNPETSKTNKVQLEAFTLSGKDAKEIAMALAEGRSLNVFDSAVTGDFVKVDQPIEAPALMGAIAAEIHSNKEKEDVEATRK